jgi:hypothetical protein
MKEFPLDRYFKLPPVIDTLAILGKEPLQKYASRFINLAVARSTLLSRGLSARSS